MNTIMRTECGENNFIIYYKTPMKKFIIEIDDDIDDVKAFGFIKRAIDQWKISKEWSWKPTYCRVTMFNNGTEEIVVYNKLNYNTDTITLKVLRRN